MILIHRKTEDMWLSQLELSLQGQLEVHIAVQADIELPEEQQ
jgi:hypothetical protein